jgi:hypothetical protein
MTPTPELRFVERDRLRKELADLQAKVQEQALQIISLIGQEFDAEPVAWVTLWLEHDGKRVPRYTTGSKRPQYGEPLDSVLDVHPLYTHPPRAQSEPKAELVQDGLRKAAQMALEALEPCLTWEDGTTDVDVLAAIEALRKELGE